MWCFDPCYYVLECLRAFIQFCSGGGLAICFSSSKYRIIHRWVNKYHFKSWVSVQIWHFWFKLGTFNLHKSVSWDVFSKCILQVHLSWWQVPFQLLGVFVSNRAVSFGVEHCVTIFPKALMSLSSSIHLYILFGNIILWASSSHWNRAFWYVSYS